MEERVSPTSHYMREQLESIQRESEWLRMLSWGHVPGLLTMETQQSLDKRKEPTIATINKLIVYLKRLKAEVVGLEMVKIEEEE